MLIEISFKALRSSIKYFELTTAIVGTLYLHKYKKTFLKYFLFTLWFIVIIEFFGKWYRMNIGNNHIVYNVYNFINFSFLLILYLTYLKKKIHKKWVTYFLIFYIVSFFLNSIIQNYMTQIQVAPFIVGALCIIITIIFYFSEILNSNQVLYISKNLLFWISVGLLLYFVGKIPTRIVKNYWTGMNGYGYISITEFILSIIMNIFFITGFVCSEKIKPH